MKKLFAFVVGLVAFVHVQAATVMVAPGASQTITTGNSYYFVTNKTTLNAPQDFDYTLTLLNDFLVTFRLLDTNLDGYSATYSVAGQTPFTLLEGQSLSNLLTAGTYAFRITLPAGASLFSATTEISAVPLPGAALLFGSALLGAGALRRKKQQEETEAVAA